MVKRTILQINTIFTASHAGELDAQLLKGNIMAGRKKLPDHLLKNPRRGPRVRAPYNSRPIEMRGKAGAEPTVMRAFWTDYTMDEVMAMTDEEVMQAIDKSLNSFVERQKNLDPNWHFPISRPMMNLDKKYNKK